jgi:hypothetical protein
LDPIFGNRKIHPLEFLQTQLDVGMLIVNEENSDDSPPVGRNPTRNKPLMDLMRFILGYVRHGTPLLIVQSHAG